MRGKARWSPDDRVVISRTDYERLRCAHYVALAVASYLEGVVYSLDPHEQQRLWDAMLRDLVKWGEDIPLDWVPAPLLLSPGQDELAPYQALPPAFIRRN